MVKCDPISELWFWFATNAEVIRDAYNRCDERWLESEISPRIEQITEDMSWEIGPYGHPHEVFVLSPTTRANLPVARRVVAAAPTLEGWRFLAAKPPKELLSLEFLAVGVSINADHWRYQLTAYNNGAFVDIEILFDQASAPPGEHVHLFCELVVEALIGEEIRLERVGYITPKIVDDASAIEKITPISYLRRHLEQILAPRAS